MSCRLGALAIAIAALAAGSCTSVDPGLGEAHRYNMAIQTIDPDPVYPEDGAKPGDSGTKAAKATERYRKDAVKPVEIMTSTESFGSSGSGPN